MSDATGGCQCGKVRFRVSRFGRASICHCRMCQKATGSFFGAFVTAHDLVWTRGEPKRFPSSNQAQRGFCVDCGTPLTFEPGGPVEIAIGALDDPTRAAPVIQVNPESKLAFFDGLCTLPVRADGAEPNAEAFKTAVVNYQHPDHDTSAWRPGSLP